MQPGTKLDYALGVDRIIFFKTSESLMGSICPYCDDEMEMLRLTASLEKGSEPPLAVAIVNGAGERRIDLVEASDFESVTGKGVKGSVDGKQIVFGNIKRFKELKIFTN